MSDVRVARLVRYPVKACTGELLDAADVAVDGLRHDRVLAVAVGDQIVTQREHAALARVRPRLDDDTLRLVLDRDGADPVEGEGGADDGPTRTVTIFGRPVEVVDQHPSYAAWLRELTGADARLVMAPTTTRRRSPGVVEGLTVLADEGTVSVHSEASLADLNRRLADRDHPPLGPDRFRANVVLSGCDAHAEDRAATLETAGVLLAFAQTDERCVVTTVDQDAGRRAGPEPIRTLSTYRRSPNGGGVEFGSFFAVQRPGRLRVGDPVVLRES